MDDLNAGAFVGKRSSNTEHAGGHRRQRDYAGFRHICSWNVLTAVV